MATGRRNEEHGRIIAEMRTRTQTGAELTPLIAGLHALLAGQTVPEWRAVLNAVQQLDHVGAGPAGYWGMSTRH